MQMAGFLYIHRRWEQDQKLLPTILNYWRDLDHTYQVSNIEIIYNQKLIIKIKLN